MSFFINIIGFDFPIFGLRLRWLILRRIYYKISRHPFMPSFSTSIYMNTTTKTTLATVAIVSALALVIAPSLMATVSAAPNTVCVKKTGNGGTVSPPGQDQPNTPPGKANCPPPFKAKNENAVK
jgi:hypothetical protein